MKYVINLRAVRRAAFDASFLPHALFGHFKKSLLCGGALVAGAGTTGRLLEILTL